MIYGYVRVSTDKQTVENQKFEIEEFACKSNCKVDHWIEETISGCKSVNERKLGKLLSQMHQGDILICAELSRLGRNLLMIMGVLNQCMQKDIEVWTIKESYRLGNDISSKVLAFAFSLSAEIERNLISQRTKEALARRKSEGQILGRPKGSRSKVRKLTGKERIITRLLDNRTSVSAIARRLKVHRTTVSSFIRDFLMEERKLRRAQILEIADSRMFLKCNRPDFAPSEENMLSPFMIPSELRSEVSCRETERMLFPIDETCLKKWVKVSGMKFRNKRSGEAPPPEQV